MDKATRKLRARMKAERTPRGQLSRIEPRGLGRKNAIERYPTTTCTHIEGGEKVPWRRKRKDGSTYVVMIIVGGTRCVCPAEVKGKNGWRCLAHL
jgi:hypothetical protein